MKELRRGADRDGHAQGQRRELRQADGAAEARLARTCWRSSSLRAARCCRRRRSSFSSRAAERFGHAEQANKEAVKSLLDPVHQRLKSYEEQVAALEAKRVDSFGQLTGLIETMRLGQEEVRREAQRLGNSLTNAPKARGRWGERALQNVLEQCGLSEHTDFNLEHSIDTEDGRLRPDAIINVPGQKKIVIDAKFRSTPTRKRSRPTTTKPARRRSTRMPARCATTCSNSAPSRYQSQFEEAPDYVVMFVPGEHFVAAALEHDPELWDFAFEQACYWRRRPISSPSPGPLRKSGARTAWLARPREIGRMGAELYERLAVAADHLKGMGAGLDRAVRKYNDFVGSFERNVLSSGKRLAEKGIETGKREIEEVPLIDNAPRYTSADDGEEAAEAASKRQPLRAVTETSTFTPASTWLSCHPPTPSPKSLRLIVSSPSILATLPSMVRVNGRLAGLLVPRIVSVPSAT